MALTKTGETPWTKILTSGPVRAIVSAQICLLFNVNTSVNHVPSYMDQVLHFNIKQNGLLSSLPYIGELCLHIWMTLIINYVTGLYSMGVVVARIADKCRKSQTFSLISIRRIFSGLPFFLSMLLLTVKSFWGYDPVVSIFVFTLWQVVTSIGIGGYISKCSGHFSNIFCYHLWYGSWMWKSDKLSGNRTGFLLYG
jgi:ACS family sodium-dependent inorganic phosphate cotransporter